MGRSKAIVVEKPDVPSSPPESSPKLPDPPLPSPNKSQVPTSAGAPDAADSSEPESAKKRTSVRKRLSKLVDEEEEPKRKMTKREVTSKVGRPKKGTRREPEELVDPPTIERPKTPVLNKDGTPRMRLPKWTPEEDELLVHYKEEMSFSWKYIARLLGRTHSWQAVQMRYLRVHKPRNENWTQGDETRLVSAIKRDWDRRWKRISADLGPSFSVDRVRDKMRELCGDLDNVKNSQLTSEQDKKLLLVYMGLDSISYESDDEKNGGVETTPTPVIEESKPETDAVEPALEKAI